MSTIESKFNGYPAVTDWDKAIFVLQQANAEGFNGATKKEIFQELFGDVVIQGAGYEDLPVAESSDPVPLPIPEAEQRFGFLANGKYTQPNGPDLVYTDKQWGLVLFDNEKWVKKFTLDLPETTGVDTVRKDGEGLPKESAVYRNIPTIFVEEYDESPDPEQTIVGRIDNTTGTSMSWTNINGNAVAYNSSFVFDKDGKVKNIKVVANTTGNIRFAIIEHNPKADPVQVVTRIALSETFAVVVGVNSFDVDLPAVIGQRLAIHDTTAKIDWQGSNYIPNNTTFRAFVNGTTGPTEAQSSLAMSFVFEVQSEPVLKSFLDAEYRRKDDAIEGNGTVALNDTGLVNGDTTYKAIPEVVIENIQQGDEDILNSYGSTIPKGTPPSWTNINGNNIAYSEGFPILKDGNLKKIQYNSLGAGTIRFGVISHNAALPDPRVLHSTTDTYDIVEGINVFNLNIPVLEGQFVAILNLTGGLLNINDLGSRIVRTTTTGSNTFATGSAAMSFEVSSIVVNPLKKALDDRYLNKVVDNSYVSKLFSISELGAVLFPSLKRTDYIHIAESGQSLSRGGETGHGITTDPISGNYMYSTYIADYTTENANLNPLVNTLQEDLIVPCVNVFSQLYRRDVDANAKFIASSSGIGGTPVLELTTLRYYQFQNHIQRIKSAVSNEGKTVSCPIIVYVQGESDYIASKANSVAADATTYQDRVNLYKSRLIALKNKMQQTIMDTYGQTEKPLFLVHQPQGEWAYFKDKFVHMAQIQACDENDDMILLGSPYFTPQYSVGHLCTNGYRWWGEMIGKYMYDIVVKGLRTETVRPKRFTISGSKIYIDHLVPKPPLVIDTWTVSDRPGKGFQIFLDDIATNISSVTLIGSNTVCLDMGVDLEAYDKIQVNYGSPYDNGEFHKGLGEGNLRDSDKWVSMYPYSDDSEEISTAGNTIPYRPLDEKGDNIFGKKYPMQNWSCIYSEIIKG